MADRDHINKIVDRVLQVEPEYLDGATGRIRKSAQLELAAAAPDLAREIRHLHTLMGAYEERTSAPQEALDTIEVPVFKRDLGAMLISAVRYALGRMSYIAGPTCTWVMTYWNYIPDEDASTLLSELRHWVHIQDSATPGYRVGLDLVEWRNLLDWMEENYVVER